MPVENPTPLVRFRAYISRFDLIVLGLFLVINGVVLTNAIRHDPLRGYDSEHHFVNIEFLSTGRFPGPEDSREFFSPPLPYLVPALLLRVTGWEMGTVGKIAQMLNVLLSIGVTVYLLKICDIVRPSQVAMKRGALLCLAIFPVYYKTFAFVRGEPYVVFFAMQSVYLALLGLVERALPSKRMIQLGVALGMGALSRQWGILLIPPIALFIWLIALRAKLGWMNFVKGLTLCLGVAFILSGWFYIYQKMTYGTATAFNRPPQPYFSLANQPVGFYFGLGNGKLFSEPVRNSFPNQLIPVFYSETWGDYWCYYLVFGKDKRNDELYFSNTLVEMMQRDPLPRWFITNRDTMVPYLANLNRVGLFPTALAFAAFWMGVAGSIRFFRDAQNERIFGMMFLFCCIIIVSWLAYLWLLIMYPFPSGDMIKATYMLHLFPLIAILMSELSLLIQQRSTRIYRVLMILLGLVLLFNLPAFFSRAVSMD